MFAETQFQRQQPSDKSPPPLITSAADSYRDSRGSRRGERRGRGGGIKPPLPSPAEHPADVVALQPRPQHPRRNTTGVLVTSGQPARGERATLENRPRVLTSCIRYFHLEVYFDKRAAVKSHDSKQTNIQTLSSPCEFL